MNNNMIMELINAGTDLRKLSPEFLEKLCRIYENPAQREEVKADKSVTLSEVLTALRLMQISGSDLFDRDCLVDMLMERDKEAVIRYYKKLYRIVDPLPENERALTLVSSFLETM